MVTRYLNRQIEEIASDIVLRIYGAFLALYHCDTVLWWIHEGTYKFLNRQSEHICWPLFDGCQSYWYPTSQQENIILAAYFTGGLLVTALFAKKQLVRYAFGGLIVLQVLKFWLQALDFRTEMNQYYMVLFVTVPLLFLPHKGNTIRIITPLFYFWAGMLKLNKEWLSGSAIFGHIWFFDNWMLPWACRYVVVMELVVAWGLWSRSNLVFWMSLVQLVTFHIISYSVVGYLYPLLMFSMLSIFVLYRLKENEPMGHGVLQWCRSREGRFGVAWALFFSLLQLVPRVFPGDPAITGEGRLFALHMFDAKAQCQAVAVVRRDGQEPEQVNLRQIAGLTARIQCDPIIYYNRARTLCGSLSPSDGFVDLDLKLSAKRISDNEMHRVIDLPNFCHSMPRYSSFWPNAWILR